VDFEQARDARNRQRWTVIIGLAAAVVFCAVWFALLTTVTPDDHRQTAFPPSVASPGTEAAAAPCPDPAAQTPACVARREALEVWAEVAAMADALSAREALSWAPETFGPAMTALETAEKQFAAEQFADAATTFADAGALFRQTDAIGGDVFAAYLEQGRSALENEQTDDAIAAYEMAAKIDPSSDVAIAGQQRARVQKDVIDLFYRGGIARAENRLTDARDLYQQALVLDPEYTKASAALTAVRAEIREAAFGRHVSDGLAALSRRDADAALAAFNRALEIRSEAQEALDGRAQAEAMARSQTVRALIAQAGDAAQDEQWDAARSLYAQALTLEPTAQDATDGLGQMDRLLGLDAEIGDLIARPQRLSSRAVFQHATNVLADARAVESDWPRLKSKTEALSRLMAAMQTPVRVTLKSDGRTAVSIQRVGAIGTFEQKDIDILPGSYAITGARAGFRDVRHEITVMPGSEPLTVTVMCNDEF
jgi:tetratricopeptide (TPR) repeat protein